MTMIVYSKDGDIRSTQIHPRRCVTAPKTVDEEGKALPAVVEVLDGQDLVDWYLARDRLPFGPDDDYRLLDDASIPTGWPPKEWGAAFLADGTLPSGDYTPTLTIDDYEVAIQAMIDATAQSRSYMDGTSVATYEGCGVADWEAEAATFKVWRAAVWTYTFAQLDDVQAGNRPAPTVEAFLAEITPIAWPS